MSTNLVLDRLRYRGCSVVADVNCQFPANLDYDADEEDGGTIIKGCTNCCLKCGQDVCRSPGCSSIVTYNLRIRENGKIRILKRVRLCDTCRDEVREDRAKAKVRHAKNETRDAALAKALALVEKSAVVFVGLHPHEDVCSSKWGDGTGGSFAVCALPKTHEGWHREATHVLWGIGATWKRRRGT